MLCEKCGKPLAVGQTVCTDCFDPYEDEEDVNDDNNDDDDDDDTHQTLNDIKLSNEEFSVRTYRCSELKFPSCTGYVSVTNRRVLFHGYGGSSRIVNEVPLDSVAGISTLYGGKLLIGRLIIGVSFIIAAIFAFSNSVSQEPAYIINGSRYVNSLSPPYNVSPILLTIGIFTLLIGIFFIIICYKKTFMLKIYSSKANNSPIDIGSGAGGIIGSSALFTVVAYPTDQTDKMMLELGAMINDLQNMGDYGVEKWKK